MPSTRRPVHRLALAALLALLAPALPAGAQRAPARHRPTTAARAQLSDSAAALHLLQRASFGPRPGDLATVLRQDRAAWLDAQLHPERIDDSALDTRLASYPAASMSVAQLYRAYPPPAALRRAQQQAGGAPGGDSMRAPAPGRRRAAVAMAGDSMAGGPPRPPRPLGAAVMSAARMVGEIAGARLARDVYSQRQLQEVMTDFWFNHFNVFVGKGPDRWLVSRYEQDAIRPYVFGRFEDMLKATATHPAMLVYLDNWMSASPDTTDPAYLRRQERLRTFAAMTPAQQQALVDSGRMTPQQLARLRQVVQQAGPRKPGINENYARELMELHTLGVAGGYSQADVVAVARAFTGWTITRPRIGPDAPADADVAFVFRPELHDRGEKVVLGTPLRPGRGMEDGLDVLHMLATAPATAHHIARQLVERFVSDRPDSAMVERIARVFLDTGGDLRAVTRALFTDPAFDDPGNVGNKVKTPIELLASALRASNADVGPGPSRSLLQTLRTLGEVPYGESFPTGYPAAAAEWVNSGAMLARMNFALALAAGRLDRVRVDPAATVATAASGAPVAPVGPGGAPADTVAALAVAFLPGADTRRLQDAVRSELAQQPAAAPRERLARAAGLILGSPDFQRR